MKAIRIFLLVLIIIGIILLATQSFWVPKLVNTILESENSPVISAPDFKTATYVIDGQPIALVNGRAEFPSAPGSASKTVTQYFGNEAVGDLNGDGRPDVAFILTQNGGGSGTFYYAVVALATANGYEGTNGFLLGDRIAPQNTEIKNGQIIFNYADRMPGEPMSTTPSVGVSKYLKVSRQSLVLAQ